MVEIQRDSASETPASESLPESIEVYGDRLLRSAYLLCGDETEAQDLVQETVLQAFKSAHRFRRESAVYTWLYGILRNLCHRHLRKQKRLVLDEERVLMESVEDTPAHAMDQAVRAARLVQALQALSPEHREIIVLRYYENLRIGAIAERVGVSKGTVKSRLHYAVRALEQIVPKDMNLFASAGTQDQDAL
jgi:RNA polymerase sigma-70 factor (ECF subfamily)